MDQTKSHRINTRVPQIDDADGQVGKAMIPPIIAHCLVATVVLLVVDVSLAQSELPAEFHGDWVSAETDCASSVRFRVASDHVTLINGPDSTSYGDVAIAHSFFGPEYTGIAVAAIPESNSDNYPFLIYFNADELEGVTKLDIYQEIQGTLNPQVSAIQAAAKKLAERYPLNSIPLKKCGAD